MSICDHSSKSKTMLKISEIFYSIQGEGKYIGNPSVFVRVGGCNLSCNGFGIEVDKDTQKIIGCDSIYAANQAFKEEWIIYQDENLLIQDVVECAQKHMGGSAFPFDIVLTGGEPSLYFQDQVLLSMCQHFLDRHHRISVESNGSIFFNFNPILSQFSFTVSPKLSNAKEKRSIHLPALQNILDHAREVNFKFVVDSIMCESGKAEEEIDQILSQLSGSYDVFLMPLGVDNKELDHNLKAILQLAMKRGYRVTDRLHIRLFGNARGK